MSNRIFMSLSASLLVGSLCAAELDLAGAWTLTQADDAKVTCSVKVPGGIYGALYAAGRIPDPYFAQNEKLTQWPSRKEWIFSRNFTVSAEMASAKALTLRIEDADCFSTVSINGREVGRTTSRFERFDFDVKPFLRVGENSIEAKFGSTECISYAETNHYDREYNICNCTVKRINLVRTVQCHGGWDWGITQMETGLMGDVKIVSSDVARLDYAYTTQRFSQDYSSVDVDVTAEVTSPAGGETDFAVAIGDCKATRRVKLVAGANKITQTLHIAKPRLWWPVGYGEQNLYPMTVRVGEATLERRLGLRKMEVINEEDATPDPATGKKGKPMVVAVNGTRIFCKGADWIPCDAFECRQTAARYADLLGSALAANMNCVRLWGGGQFEHPAFYDFCDEKGILIWHDFMFSCATYPGDERFMKGVRREIAHQLRKLRDRASIALWCGDNECIGAAGWFGESQRAANIKICIARAKELADLCAKYDPTRCFWPSSPCLGPGNYGDGWKDDSSGDMHFWTVWGGGKPFDFYYTVRPRFCSEFGFQSYPSEEVARTFVNEDQLNPTAPDFFYHQKAPSGNRKILNTILENFRFPEGVRSLLYLSQVQQAIAIRTAADAWRPLQPRCMGIIFWQLNDNWPVASWSSVEYTGKWKQLQYNMKREYAPLMISAAPKWKNPGILEFWAVNDNPDPFVGNAEIVQWGFDGTHRTFATLPAKIPARASVKLGEYPVAEFGDDTARARTFLRLGLKGRAGTKSDAAANDWMFARFKDCPLAKTDLRTEFKELDGKMSVTVSCDKPAFFVWANVNGIRGEFDDNSFTLLPNESRTIVFSPKDPAVSPEAVRKAFSLMHLRETYR